jgi:5-formyltetrahydrofolate cyclo-ligase
MDATADGPAGAKARLRRRLLDARRAIGDDGRSAQALAIADGFLSLPLVRELPRGSTVAAYVGVGTEPSTATLLAGLHEVGLRVLLPIWPPGATDLDWALFTGSGGLSTSPAGLQEPMGPPLGVEAIAAATVIVLPALAVDRGGNRLGRGAGAYDAALRRVGPATWTCALLYTGELVHELPVEPHDRPVSAVALPDGVVELARH